MSGRSVLVSGIPKDLEKDDLLIYFQSKKKSNGGEIVDIEFDSERGEAKILFKEASVAKDVLSRTIHKYKKVPLTVVEDMPSSDKAHGKSYQEEYECSSVIVSGLSSNTTKDAIQMYFENSRRSSGGEVKSVELDGDQAIVTFESPEVAKRVLEWSKHTLDGCPLTVRPVQPKKPSSLNEEKEESEEPVQRSKVVRVQGISDTTTKDALLNFFENTRRSGGGEIEDIQHIPDEGMADITFCSPDDAERVSQKQDLKLDGCGLTVTLKEIPKEIPKDPYKLHVMGISEKTTKDGLTSFMEVVSGEEVESMLFGSNSNVMVTFKELPDLEKVQNKCSRRALDGSHLKIEQVNICDCIEVSGLAHNTTRDTVFFYFDNPRNGGGEVKSVEMDLENARAMLFFEDPSVVNNVTRKEHKINEAVLEVVPYYPFLGETSTNPGGGKKEKVVKVDPQGMGFIKKFFQQEFDQLFQEWRVRYKWQEGSGEIVLGCTEPKMEKTTWENSCEAVVSYINQIVTEKITVSPDAWKELYEKAKEIFSEFKDRLHITCKEKKHSFTLIGKKPDVSTLAEKLKDLNSEIEKQIIYEKNKTSKNISLSESQFDLLSLSGFVEDLRGRFKDLEVTMSSKDLAINFIGPDSVVREGNISVWQSLSKIKEGEIELPKSIVTIVGSEAGKVFLATHFKKAHIDAVISLDPNNDTQLMVTAVDRRDMKKAVDLIKDLTSEQSIPLDADQKQLLHTEKWKKLKHSIHQSMLLRVTEEPAASTLWIAGIEEEVEKAKEKVERFFEENIILNKVIEAENGRVKFIFKYKRDALKNMEQSLSGHQVTLEKGEEYQLVVSGTRDGIGQAIPKVEKLIDDIKKRKVDLEMPGMKKLFSEKKGINLLSVVENDHNCIIERCTPSREIKSTPVKYFDEGKRLSKMVCSYETPEGKKIVLYKGDLTEHMVDVMVNAANKGLKHIGGVAKSIVNKGGRSIQDECDEFVLRNGELLDGEVFVSAPGNLPCKRLVHAVGPIWSYRAQSRKLKGEQPREESILSLTIHNSLKMAKGFRSIALPAISSGVFGFPVEVCAQVLLESVLEYSEQNSHAKLSEIHFVDMNESAIKAFHDEMRTRFGKESSYTDGVAPKEKARKDGVRKEKGRGRREIKPAKEEELEISSVDVEEEGNYEDSNSFTTAQGMKIMIIVGDMAKEEAHVIVNTVSSDLNLDKNPCAKALSNAAGPGLQQECKSKGSLSAGKMLATDGYNLGCKNVFHVVAAPWENGKGEKIMRSLIQSCLKEAHKRGFSSIAFPAIGTGNLAFPRDVVARCFFEEADAFKGQNPQSPLSELHLVLFYKDEPTIQAFQDELKANRKPAAKKAKGKRRSHVFKNEDGEDFGNAISREPIDSFVNISDEDTSNGATYIGSVRLEIISGDITKETTDAIATVSNPFLNVSQGGVGIAIAKAGGPSIQKECNKLGKQQPGSVVYTSAGSLLTSGIFHLVSSSFKPADISDVLFKCFLKAESMGIKSLAVPAIGTGMANIDPKNAAKALLTTIERFSQEQPTSLIHIRVVVFQKHMLKTFYDAIEDLSKSQSGIWGKMWKGFKSLLSEIVGSSKPYVPLNESTMEDASTSSYASECNMWLQIFAANNNDLGKAETDIKEIMKDHLKTKEIEHKAIGKLSDAQRERVMRMEGKHHTKIRIDNKINRIVVRGVSEDVSTATLAIYEILNEKSEEEHSRRYAELLSKNVQWYYSSEKGDEPYDEKTNAKIEQAYKDKKTCVIVLLDEEDGEEPTRYKIDFPSMTETNLDTGETITVERKEATSGISLPSHWDPQPTDANGKELDVHLVALNPSTKEYDDIKKAIEKTSPINIIKIERVQNPGLYKTYAVKKQKMDDKNGSNEKKLFHGTAPTTCPLINHQGFNRSFCGKNATVIGKGVYFARDASYSMRATYSPADPFTKNRFMYLASVLAGEYAQGHQDMITPPPKNANNPSVTYDTVVDNVPNPSVYVVFHDTQNYPDYLITFK